MFSASLISKSWSACFCHSKLGAVHLTQRGDRNRLSEGMTGGECPEQRQRERVGRTESVGQTHQQQTPLCLHEIIRF